MAKKKKKQQINADKVWGLTRISLGFVLFWAFLDKLVGLGFTTCRDATENTVEFMCSNAWLTGGSPTAGFLQFGTSGPLANFYQGLAGNPFVDWLFMLGLLGVGAALLLGIAMKIATVSGVLLFLMMYTATMPPTNNPVISDHIIYSLVLIGLYKQSAGQQFGLADKWRRTKLVKKYPVLR